MVFNRWNRIRDRSGSLVGQLVRWMPGLATLGGVIAWLSHVAIELPWAQATGLGMFAVVAFLVVAWLPVTGTWWNTALHVLLTFHFTVLSRVFFRAESFASAKTMTNGLLAFDGYGVRPGLVTPWVAAALAFGIAYHFTPKSWVDVHALRWFRRIPGPLLGILFALLGLWLMKLMDGQPRAFIYFQF